MILPTLRRQQPQASYRLARPSLTAAAQSGNPDQNRPVGKLRRLHQEWQLRALATYNTVGECWYPSQFYARSLAKTRFFPALLNDKGEPEEQEAGPLVELFARIRDPGMANRSELAAAYGRLQFLNGDGYLTVTQDDDGEAWEYLSVAELRIDPDDRPNAPQRYRRIRAPGVLPEELSEAADSDFAALTGTDVRVWRLWRPHPMHTQLADAPVRAVLDLYELLHRLTLAAGGEASSRAAQRGLLIVAEEIANQFGVVGADDDPDSDPFLRTLGEALSNAIQNPGSAEALSPIVLRGPAAVQTAAGAVPVTDLVKWIPLGPSTSYTEGVMWEKTIERIGNGLDLPREYLTGMAKANHWTGWLVDEVGYRQHVAPVSERFCGDLASAYLRPAAKAAGIAEWDRAVVGYDPADAILHPDKVQMAFEAYDRIIVSDSFVLEAIGATQEDAPDDEERERRTQILLKEDPYQLEGDEPEGETSPTDGGTGGDTSKTPPKQGAGANGNTPKSPAPDDGPGVVISSAALQPAAIAAALQQAKILGASELQVQRAREIAGNKLVRRAQSCSECQDKLALKPTANLVAAILGAETVREIIDGHTSEAALVGGAGASLANTLRVWGVTGEWPQQLGELVEQHALRTLYEEVPPPLPPGFAAVVAKALR